MGEQGVFDTLLTILRESKRLMGSGFVMVSVEAYMRGGDEWLLGVCDETILIIFEHETLNERMSVECMQSQRYLLKIVDGNRATFLAVPFDKVDRFVGAERVEGYKKTPYFPYEVALSFAGEDRPYVSRVARMLRKKSIRIFYDEYEKVELWGKDLYSHLDDIYRNQARFCVLFLSRHYKEKVWTNHERESAQARAFESKENYLLPVRLDDTAIAGIRPTLGYVDGVSIRPEALASLIEKKLLTID